MWALNNNYPFKKYCNLWSNICGVHNGTADKSGHAKLSWLYQTINFITNCCQYNMIWCKCYPVINNIFNISCYKVLLPLLLSFLASVDKNVHVIMLGLLLTCVETGSIFALQSCSFWADCWNSVFNLETRPLWFRHRRCNKKDIRDIFSLC